MEFYDHTYWQVMDLPIKTFWLMNENIDRIQAQKDMRSLTIAFSAQSQAAADQFRQRLIAETGTIVKLERGTGRAFIHEERDEAGFAELKELSKLL